MGEFAKLWAAYEYEYKTTVTADMVEMSAVVDRIVNKCHMAVIQVTGMHCFSWICFFLQNNCHDISVLYCCKSSLLI